MKALLLIAALFSISQASFAADMECRPTEFGTVSEDGAFGFEREMKMNCTDHDTSQGYTAHLYGVGINAKSATLDGHRIGIQCPLKKELSGTYYGLYVDAAIVYGVDAGVFGSGDGVCFVLGGQNLSFFAAIDGMKLTITKEQ